MRFHDDSFEIAYGLLRADRKSTRLNSSHSQISYAVFCLKKKKKYRTCSAAPPFHDASRACASPARRTAPRSHLHLHLFLSVYTDPLLPNASPSNFACDSHLG